MPLDSVCFEIAIVLFYIVIQFLNKILEHFSSVQARRQKRLAEDERFLEFQRKTESL